MPNPLSLDLRQRIVQSYRQGEGTVREIAVRFHVSASSVARLLALDRTQEELRPLPHSGGRSKQKLFDEHRQALLQWLEQEPDLTLMQLVGKLEQEYGITVHNSQISRHLRDLNWTIKKKA